MQELIKCPFCGEEGFDRVGLKGHLLYWCEMFERTETPDEEISRKLREARKAQQQ